MRLNLDTTLSAAGPATPPILLVPYTPAHVPTYHAWMEDDELRAATGSERLTFEEEVAMQAAWAEDEDKLTFIILDGAALAEAEGKGMSRRDAGLTSMVGDVNLFLLAEHPDEEEGESKVRNGLAGEVEIMVASPSARGRGFGAESVRLLLAYARSRLGLRTVVAKIGRSNAASRRLFTERLGFAVVKEVAVFDEVHLRADLPAAEGVHPAVAEAWSEGRYGEWLDGV